MLVENRIIKKFLSLNATVSGLSGSTATAQSQVSVGMGLLAGSTVMLLTIIWGSCIIVGKCDIREEDSIAIDGRNTKGFNITGMLFLPCLDGTKLVNFG